MALKPTAAPVTTPGATHDPHIRVPVVRVADRCHDQQPGGGFHCSRPTGHTGRHLFAWLNLDGRVRAVWGGEAA